MKAHHAAIAFAAAAIFASPPASMAASRAAGAIHAAVTDSHRPAADTMRDADRKPAAVLAFSGVKPGDRIAELIPGGGYMTRLLSDVAGPKGHVYALNLTAMGPRFDSALKPVLDDAHYSNVTLSDMNFAALTVPAPVDVVWTSMNYHDLKNPGMFAADTPAMDKAVYAALKPGGLYIIIDHAAQAGSGTRDTGTLHRIDPDVVKKEVLAAGFKLEGQSKLLANAKDPHTGPVDDASDKFFFKFRKPG